MPYVVGLPASETVTVGSESFAKSWTYDSATGFRTSQSNYGIETTFTKDSYGNLASAGSATNKTTMYEYQWGQLSAIHTPEYGVTRTINQDGTLASETRAGRITSYGYDALRRPTSVQPPDNTHPTTIQYDSAGAWVRRTRGSSQVTTNVDGFDRPNGMLNNVGVQTRTSYDAEGRVVYEGYPFRPADVSGNVDIGSQIEYDGLGRVTKRINPDASTLDRSYGEAGVVTITDEEERDTVQTWRAFGDPDDPRLASLVDAREHTWTYTYNAIGQLTDVAADDGVARAWRYNAHGLLDHDTHPESGTATYGYDDAGVLATKQDANGTTTTFTYDDNDRVRTMTAGGRTTRLSYEPGSDNLRSATNGSVDSLLLYDNAGRLQTRQDAIEGKVFLTSYEYDADDNLTAIVYPSGRRVQYDYNAEHQITRVSEPAAGRDYATGITYHPSGGVRSSTAGNGATTTLTYDASRYWIRGITSGALQLTYDAHDGVGNVGSIGDARAGMSQTLTYDALDRLETATGPYGEALFAYDVHGNRMTANGTTYEYQPGTLRLSNQNSVAFTYANNGDMLTAGSATSPTRRRVCSRRSPTRMVQRAMPTTPTTDAFAPPWAERPRTTFVVRRTRFSRNGRTSAAQRQSAITSM